MATKKFSTPETELLAMYFNYKEKGWETAEEVKDYINNYLQSQLKKSRKGYMQFAVKQMIKSVDNVIKYDELVVKK